MEIQKPAQPAQQAGFWISQLAQSQLAHNWLNKLFLYTFERYLHIPTIHKVKVILNHSEKTYLFESQWEDLFHFQVQSANFQPNIMSHVPKLGESAEKYVSTVLLQRYWARCLIIISS